LINEFIMFLILLMHDIKRVRPIVHTDLKNVC